MADEVGSLSISVSLTADTSGAQEVVSALEQIKSAADEANSALAGAGTSSGLSVQPLASLGQTADTTGQRLAALVQPAKTSTQGLAQIGESAGAAGQQLSLFRDSAEATQQQLSFLGDSSAVTYQQLEFLDGSTGALTEDLFATGGAASTAGQGLARLGESVGLTGQQLSFFRGPADAAEEQLSFLGESTAATYKQFDYLGESTGAANQGLESLSGSADAASRPLAQAGVSAGAAGAQLGALGRTLQTVTPQTTTFSQRLTQNSAALTKAGKILTLGVTIPLVAAGKSSLNAAMDFDTAFRGIQKTVEGSEAQFAQLREDIMDMSGSSMFGQVEIANVMQTAGQLGVAVEDIRDFSQVMLELGTATNLGATDAASQLARFANITQMPLGNVRNLGSAIVALGNNTATTEAELVAMAMRLASAGEQADMSEADIMGMAAGLSSLGLQAEAGGSAFSRLIRLINNNASKGEQSLEGFAEAAGMSAKQFKTLWDSDSTAGLSAFIEGLHDSQEAGGNIAQTLQELGINEVRTLDAVMRAASGFKTFASAIDISNKAFKEGIALQEEYGKLNEGMAATMASSMNRVNEARIEIGEAMAPGVQFAANAVADLAKAFAKLPDPVQGGITVLGGLAAALGPVMAILGSSKKGLEDIGKGFAALGNVFGVGGGMAAAGVAAAIGAITLAWHAATAAQREYDTSVKKAAESSGLDKAQVAADVQAINDTYAGLSQSYKIIAQIEVEGQEHIDKLNEFFNDDGKVDKEERTELKKDIDVTVKANVEEAKQSMNGQIEEIKTALGSLTFGDIDMSKLQTELAGAFSTLNTYLADNTQASSEQLQTIQDFAANLNLTGEALKTALGNLGLSDADVETALSGITSFRDEVTALFAELGVEDPFQVQTAILKIQESFSQLYTAIEEAMSGGPEGGGGEGGADDLNSKFPDVVAQVTEWMEGLPDQINNIPVTPLDLSTLVDNLLTGGDASQVAEGMGLGSLTDEELSKLLNIDGLITQMETSLGTLDEGQKARISAAVSQLFKDTVDLQGTSLWSDAGMEQYAEEAVAKITETLAAITAAQATLNKDIDSLAGKTGEAAEAKLAQVSAGIEELTRLTVELNKLTDPELLAASLAQARVNSGVGTEEDAATALGALKYNYKVELGINQESYDSEIAKINTEINALSQPDENGQIPAARKVQIEKLQAEISDLGVTFGANEEAIKSKLLTDVANLLGSALNSEDAAGQITEALKQYGVNLDARAIVTNLLSSTGERGPDTTAADLITTDMAKIIAEAFNVPEEEIVKQMQARAGWSLGSLLTSWLTKTNENADAADVETEQTAFGRLIESVLTDDFFRGALEKVKLPEVAAADNPILKYLWGNLKLGQDNQFQDETLEEYKGVFADMGTALANLIGSEEIQRAVIDAFEKAGNLPASNATAQAEMQLAILKRLGIGAGDGLMSLTDLPPEDADRITGQIGEMTRNLISQVNELLASDDTGMEGADALKLTLKKVDLDLSKAEIGFVGGVSDSSLTGQVASAGSGMWAVLSARLAEGVEDAEPPVLPVKALKVDISEATVTTVGMPGVAEGAEGGEAAGGVESIPELTTKVDVLKADISEAKIEVSGAAGGEGEGESGPSVPIPITAVIEATPDSAQAEAQIAEAIAALSGGGEGEGGGRSVPIPITAVLEATPDSTQAEADIASGIAALESPETANKPVTVTLSATVDAGSAMSQIASVLAELSAPETITKNVTVNVVTTEKETPSGGGSGGGSNKTPTSTPTRTTSGGGEIGQGLAQGMNSSVPAVEQASNNLASAATSVAKKISRQMEISSPSRVMERIGQFIGEGLSRGLEKSAYAAQQSASLMAERVYDALSSISFTPDIGGVLAATDALNAAFERAELKQADQARPVSPSGITQNVTINAPNPLSPSRAARELLKASQDLAAMVS